MTGAEQKKRERVLQLRWRDATLGKACAVCGSRRRIKGHHVIPKSFLKTVVRSRDFRGDAVAVLWDLRNHLPVCSDCHDDHHAAIRKIPRRVVDRDCPEIQAFARELGRLTVFRLSREYPTRTKGK